MIYQRKLKFWFGPVIAFCFIIALVWLFVRIFSLYGVSIETVVAGAVLLLFLYLGYLNLPRVVKAIELNKKQVIFHHILINPTKITNITKICVIQPLHLQARAGLVIETKDRKYGVSNVPQFKEVKKLFNELEKSTGLKLLQYEKFKGYSDYKYN